jgi:hypothetical protein
VPEDLPEITRFYRGTSLTFSVNMNHRPFPGRFEPSTVERIAPGRLRLWLDVEAHGQPLATQAQVEATTWTLEGADGTDHYAVTSDFAWTLDSKPEYRAAFITSISNGDRTNALSTTVFGVLPNIQAQSVTINGAPASFDTTDFWNGETAFNRGETTIEVRVTATDGQVFTDSKTFITEPLKFSLLLGLPEAEVEFMGRTRGTGFQDSQQWFHTPPWYPRPNYNVRGIEENTGYFRSPPLTKYYHMHYYTRWQREVSLPTPFSGYGIWEMRFDNTYQFWAWPNFVPQGPTAIELASHTDGQDVSGANAVIQIRTPTNGYSNVTINGIAAEKSYTQEAFPPNSIRIHVLHSATVPLLPGANTITVTATGNALGTATYTLNRTN